MKNFLLFTFLLLLVSFLGGCKNISNEKKSSFGDYSLDEVLLLNESITEIFLKEGKVNTLDYIDSLSANVVQSSSNIKDFLKISTLFVNGTKGKATDTYKVKNGLHDLLNNKEYSKLHYLNKTYLHYYIAQQLTSRKKLKEAIAHYEKASEIIENEKEIVRENPQLFSKIMCKIYSSFNRISIKTPLLKKDKTWYDQYQKTINICSEVEYFYEVSRAYKHWAQNVRRNKNKNLKDALDKFNKSEEAYRKSDKFRLDNLWSRNYVHKISLFYELYSKVEPKMYLDSIKIYTKKLEEDFENKRIRVVTFNHVVKNNINSIIKIGQYGKAKELINHLEKQYMLDLSANCYNMALINMNKYVLERHNGSPKSYRDALINALEHIQTCESPKKVSYGIMLHNILQYLSKIDTESNDFESATKWVQLKEELDFKDRNKKDKITDQKIIFNANREIKTTINLLELKNEKIQQTKFWLRVFIGGLTALLCLLSLIFYLSKKVYIQRNRILISKNLLEEKNDSLQILNGELSKASGEIENQKKKVEAEIATKLTFIMESNQILSTMNKEVLASNLDTIQKNKLRKIININEQKDFWQNIENEFLETNKEFVEKILTIHPSLTAINVNLCILLRLGLSSKEISTLRFSTIESIKIARSRLYKLLGLNSREIDIYTYLNTLEYPKLS